MPKFDIWLRVILRNLNNIKPLDFSIQIDYPLYFIVFCLLVGALFAFFTYYQTYFGDKGRFWEFPTYLMAFIRFLAVSLIAFFLLSPLLKNFYKDVNKPAIAVLADNSRSVTLNRDSAFYRDSFNNKLSELVSRLKQDYEVNAFKFGNSMKNDLALDFSGKKTNISQALEETYNQYYNRNLGAIVLASDGIYNEGENPLSTAKKLQAPLYTVAMGDTIPPKDIFIKNIRHNKIVFAGNQFPVEITLRSESLKGQSTDLKVLKEGEVEYTTQIDIAEENMDTTIRAFLEADDPGMHKYEIKVEPVENEISKVNNQREFFVNVLESKKEILIVGQSPHPDIKILKSAIEANERYKAETFTLGQWQKVSSALDPYNLVITHELPGKNGNGRQLMKKILSERKPALFMVGNETALTAFNNLNSGLQIKGGNNAIDKVRPDLVQDFNQFKVKEGTKQVLSEMPPVYTPHGDYIFNTQHDILLKQKIGEVNTDKPLMTFLRRSDHKVGIFCGTGLWQWYLNEYRLNENHKIFNGLISKSIQLLSIKENKERFRLREPKRIFSEDERVTFEAELYNSSYEPVEGANISFEITNQEGKKYEFEFREISNGYRVDAGFLPVGEYNYKATARVGEETFDLKGRFIVKAVKHEHLNTVADHQLLYTLAQESNGDLVYPSQINKLYEAIKELDTMKPVVHREYQLKELIHNKSLFFVIIFLLGAEWLFRKYYGGY